ncbi:MAG: O-antigen ligase family protein [Steroidobacteraceae bacterium]
MAAASLPVRRPSELVSWRLAVVFTIGVVALAASPAVGATVLGCCIAAALIGPVQAVQALTVATLVAYGNPYIIKPAPLEGVLLRLVLLAAILRLVPTMRGSDLRLVWPVWLFSIAEAFSSLQESPAVLISLMKVAELFCGVTAVLIAYNHVRPAQLAGLHRWLITLGLTVIGLSGLTLLRPAIGVGGDGGLQGLLNQPQALGIFMAPFAAWALTGVLLMRRRTTRLEPWIAVLIVALIILSKARTAGFGAGAGVLVVMISRMLGRRRQGQAKLGRPILVTGLACGVLAVLAVTTGQVSKIVSDFAYKGSAGKAQNLDQAFYESRGGGAIGEWDDFLQKPLLGNGFGVYPDGQFPAGVTYFYGLPISAPIEKGFLPTAILQEGGTLGAGLLTLVIALLCRRAWRNTDLRWRAMFVACLAINAGECVFMSPGGIGMFDWLLLSLAMFSYRTNPAPAVTLQPLPRDTLSDPVAPSDPVPDLRFAEPPPFLRPSL